MPSNRHCHINSVALTVTAARLWLSRGMLFAVLLVLPGSAGADNSSFHFAPGEVVVFTESGAGHGVGMSQWGARGRALAGQDASQILAAYYQGTSVASQANDQTMIRVLLPTDQVLTLPLSQYLPSVVASEMPPRWPAAALQAQAIASRTYALWELTPKRPFDLNSTVQSQVYGAPARADATDAVVSTAGQVITYQGNIIPAFFHACSPTWTANNEDVWPGTPLPFLRGIDDVAADGTAYGGDCPYAALQAGPFSTEMLSRLLAADPRTAVGNLQTLAYGPRDRGGRLETVTLEGDAGTKTVTGDTLRAVISAGQPRSRVLLSADFQVMAAPPGTPPPAAVAPLPAGSGQPAATESNAPGPPPTLPATQTYWVLTAQDNVPLQPSAGSAAAPMVTLPQNGPLLVLAPPQGAWLYVRDPANNRVGYVAASTVTPWSAGTASAPAPAPAVAVPTPNAPAFVPFWVENFAPTPLWSGVDAQAVSFGVAPQWTRMQVIGPAISNRYPVRVWPSNGPAYVDSDRVGPVGPPVSASPNLPANPPPTATPVAFTTYVVRRGETLYAIARHFGVSEAALGKANGLTNPNQITAGQALQIPVAGGK